METKNKKVFVGLSGGVDSSVSAAILKEQGYDATGVFIKAWQPDFIECTWEEERRDAMRVCAVLKIPFLTLNLEKEYKKEVVDYMVREYEHGRTPNPDVMCNQYIKFGGFLDYALEKGADFIATGHYAQNIFDKETQKYSLHEGGDKNKDQTYFLWTLNQSHLEHTLFPIGNMEKPDVRALAKEFGLPTATKKDSQGLCFIGKVDMKKFLKNYIDEKHGNVVDESGNIVGSHEGIMFYTIGQRHGFIINTKDTEREPYYVVSKDIKNNVLVVTKNPDTTSYNPLSTSLINESWVGDAKPKKGKYFARIRYRQEPQECSVVYDGENTKIKFDKPQRGLSSGQSIVIYDEDICLGGGIVK